MALRPEIVQRVVVAFCFAKEFVYACMIQTSIRCDSRHQCLDDKNITFSCRRRRRRPEAFLFSHISMDRISLFVMIVVEDF